GLSSNEPGRAFPILLATPCIHPTLPSEAKSVGHNFSIDAFEPDPVNNMDQVRLLRSHCQDRVEGAKARPLLQDVRAIRIIGTHRNKVIVTRRITWFDGNNI